eukprot:GILK01008059.1.p1 GENE.GILK01008059.1~~GILK01008059.1.p1  ORF type:complete len:1562 (+),score=291.15 GILK01008059.1:268-4686(+)
MAARSILEGSCSMALAGAVSIRFPLESGYMYQEGMILSPDGHCRPFDEAAHGTVLGSGVGVVVLKRLSHALRDGDCIRGVIKATAINNDGAMKTGLSAPSIQGQMEVIQKAIETAKVDPSNISYVEAHGTGTKLGDPIEVRALTAAYGAYTQEKQYCAIGSVKGNLGHADTAAGVAGLIKLVLSLDRKQLPPTLHFNRPNPAIDFVNSPFRVNTQLSEWQLKQGIRSRIGAVSSFGIGGTNAHVIVEEAPRVLASQSTDPQLLVFSAKTATALQTMVENFVEYLLDTPHSLSDIAYTLQVGRSPFSLRLAIVCNTKQEAIQVLNKPVDAQQTSEKQLAVKLANGNLAMDSWRMFETQPVFQTVVDECIECIRTSLGMKVDAAILLKPQPSHDQSNPIVTLSSFVLQYALLKLLSASGVSVSGLVCDRQNVIVAAAFAGALSLTAALSLCAQRDAHNTLDLSTVEKHLLSPAGSLTLWYNGKMFDASALGDLAFWQTVQSNAKSASKEQPDSAAWLTADLQDSTSLSADIVCLRGSVEDAFRSVWSRGVSISWQAWYNSRNSSRRRVPLPTYPFERISHTVKPKANRAEIQTTVTAKSLPNATVSGKLPLNAWFHVPSWKRTSASSVKNDESTRLLIFKNSELPPASWFTQLNTESIVVTIQNGPVSLSSASASRHAMCSIPDMSCQSFDNLFDQLGKADKLPNVIIWSCSTHETRTFALLHLLQVLGNARFSAHHFQLLLLSENAQDVNGQEALDAVADMEGALALVHQQEHANTVVRALDLGSCDDKQASSAILSVFSQRRYRVAARGGHCWFETFDNIDLPSPSDQLSQLRAGGVYLITGGLGKIGLAIARHLASKYKSVKLILVARSPLPDRTQWQSIVQSASHPQTIKERISAILELERLGATVAVTVATSSDHESMRLAVNDGIRLVGGVELHGVFHAAGYTAAHSFIVDTSDEEMQEHLNPKVFGLQVLEDVLSAYTLDFCMVFSSMSAVLGGLTFGAYSAANRYMQNFVTLHNRKVAGQPWTCVLWDGWDFGETEAAGAAYMNADQGLDALTRIINARISGSVLVSTTDLTSRITKWVDKQITKASEMPVGQTQRRSKRLSVTAVSTVQHASSKTASDLSSSELALAEIWCELLGVDNVLPSDNFFDLGGDSLLAAQLHSAITQRLWVTLPLHAMMSSSLRQLAQAIDMQSLVASKVERSLPLELVELHKAEHENFKPVFVVHPVGGTIFFYRDLAKLIGKHATVYGIQSQGIFEGKEPLTTVEAMAARYIECIKAVQPVGPYQLIGGSFGGTIAFEMSRQLFAVSDKVSLLALIDSPVSLDGHVPPPLETDAEILYYCFGLQLQFSVDDLRGKSLDEQIAFVVSKSSVGADVNKFKAQMIRYLNVFKANSTAMCEYRCKPYAGSAVYFKASLLREGDPPHPEHGWNKIVEGGFELVSVPGDHISMNLMPNASVITNNLFPRLTR